MQCTNCGGEDCTVQFVETGQVTTRKGTGYGGHMNNAARMTTAFCTFGISSLFWKKSKGTNKTKTVNQKVAICQSCGNTWVLEDGRMGSGPSSIFK